MRVALGLDGVLLDFDGAWHGFAEDVVGRNLSKVAETHNNGLRYGLSPEETDRVWKQFDTHDNWASIRLTSSAYRLVVGLESIGFSVFGVSAVPVHLCEARAESLEGLIPAGRIYCVGSLRGKDGPDKTEALRRISPVGFLDDHPLFVEQGLGLGIPVVSWYDNELYPDVHVEDISGAAVIDDPLDFLEVIRKVAR